MNILVKNYGSGLCNVRPGTTWERRSRRVRFPADVGAVAWTPVLFARITRAGRTVAAEEAGGYFDAVGYGLLLYDGTALRAGTAAGYANASCLDHSSFLPVPMYHRLTLGEPGNHYRLYKGGRKLFDYNAGTEAAVAEAIAAATARTRVRAGDLLCIELARPKHLCRRGDAPVRITASYCDNPLLDFDIIM